MHKVHSKVLLLSEYPSFIVFNFELVNGVKFLRENLPYNLHVYLYRVVLKLS